MQGGNGAADKSVLHALQQRVEATPYHCRMRDLQFDDMHLFTRVVELGTLSAVARERDAPVSQVSRAISRIEKACGARLIHRSTHGLSLTAEGRTFREYCQRMIGTLDELEGEFATSSREPRGTVRVASSTVIAHYQLVPSLPSLAARHPLLRVDLQVNDSIVDMAREGIDIAIRTANTLPETVVARQIGALGRRLYAAPSYAAAHGLPKHPDELSAHTLITNNNVTSLNQWPFRIKGKAITFAAEGRWGTNDTNMAATMVLQGLGIGRLATLVGDALVRQQLLVPVLEKYVDSNPVPIYAVTASGRHRLPKIKACIDHWAGWFRQGAAAPATS